ncbi:NADH dehydrogenase [ubiquinone] 1 alpha subcomplex subunit 7-like [Acanthaster planci]|uniref:NADH dehydrogenase [ubiquinone] 1 alpha subcomplex subunit 7 n=1 Tax=Acanthaster planci TaxID=133434 RepID=A0A8B7Y835_ACAPL|nr:NADH dehydrogenase [ubiquinone] 1 alpha subcomplex subunit 7-like [Acanthaster planci]
MATASPIIQALRNFLSGRNLQAKLQLRYAPEIAPRSIPEPNLPDGVSHKLAENYYFTRDGRRDSKPATLVYSSVKRLAEPQPAEGGSGTPALRKPVTPGIPPTWKLSTDEPYLK